MLGSGGRRRSPRAAGATPQAALGAARRALLVLLLASAVGCGGDDDGVAGPDSGGGVDGAGADAANPETCAIAPGDGPSFDAEADACQNLSSYRFFTDGAGLTPNLGVVPYDLTSALFADYTAKYRAIWLPEGETITYNADGVWDIPVGAVIIKTFAALADLREPQGARTLIETRLMVHKADGWTPMTYLWNPEQTDATLLRIGGIVPIQWIHTDGAARMTSYVIPNVNQCKTCHESTGEVAPIGPKARYLNRDYAYADGTENQLTHLASVGYLTGAPADPADAPRLPAWDDPEQGTVEERARTYLEINCGHCHSDTGLARTTGLFLTYAEADPHVLGVCKRPIAAGPGSGEFDFDIVPGQPDQSILTFRMGSIQPAIMMPELGRTVVHDEALAVVNQWIAELDLPPCETP